MFHARLPYDHSRRNSVAGSTILRVRRNPSQTFWTAGRLRRGPVRSPLSQRRSPRFPPACAPCLRCHATGLTPDTVARRSTPFDEGLRGAATGLAPDTVVRRSTPFKGELRPSAEQLPPSTGELRGAATGLTPDTVARRSTPFDEGLRPSAEDRVVLRPALRRIPSPGGQRPSTGELRGAATGLAPDTVVRRSTPFDGGAARRCDRPSSIFHAHIPLLSRRSQNNRKIYYKPS